MDNDNDDYNDNDNIDDQNQDVNADDDNPDQAQNDDVNPEVPVQEEEIDYYDGLTDLEEEGGIIQKKSFDPLSFNRTPFLEALHAREDTSEFLAALEKEEKPILKDLVKRDKTKDSPLLFMCREFNNESLTKVLPQILKVLQKMDRIHWNIEHKTFLHMLAENKQLDLSEKAAIIKQIKQENAELYNKTVLCSDINRNLPFTIGMYSLKKFADAALGSRIELLQALLPQETAAETLKSACGLLGKNTDCIIDIGIQRSHDGEFKELVEQPMLALFSLDQIDLTLELIKMKFFHIRGNFTPAFRSFRPSASPNFYVWSWLEHCLRDSKTKARSIQIEKAFFEAYKKEIKNEFVDIGGKIAAEKPLSKLDETEYAELVEYGSAELMKTQHRFFIHYLYASLQLGLTVEEVFERPILKFFTKEVLPQAFAHSNYLRELIVGLKKYFLEDKSQNGKFWDILFCLIGKMKKLMAPLDFSYFVIAWGTDGPDLLVSDKLVKLFTDYVWKEMMKLSQRDRMQIIYEWLRKFAWIPARKRPTYEWFLKVILAESEGVIESLIPNSLFEDFILNSALQSNNRALILQVLKKFKGKFKRLTEIDIADVSSEEEIQKVEDTSDVYVQIYSGIGKVTIADENFYLLPTPISGEGGSEYGNASDSIMVKLSKPSTIPYVLRTREVFEEIIAQNIYIEEIDEILKKSDKLPLWAIELLQKQNNLDKTALKTPKFYKALNYEEFLNKLNYFLDNQESIQSYLLKKNEPICYAFQTFSEKELIDLVDNILMKNQSDQYHTITQLLSMESDTLNVIQIVIERKFASLFKCLIRYLKANTQDISSFQKVIRETIVRENEKDKINYCAEGLVMGFAEILGLFNEPKDYELDGESSIEPFLQEVLRTLLIAYVKGIQTDKEIIDTLEKFFDGKKYFARDCNRTVFEVLLINIAKALSQESIDFEIQETENEDSQNSGHVIPLFTHFITQLLGLSITLLPLKRIKVSRVGPELVPSRTISYLRKSLMEIAQLPGVNKIPKASTCRDFKEVEKLFGFELPKTMDAISLYVLILDLISMLSMLEVSKAESWSRDQEVKEFTSTITFINSGLSPEKLEYTYEKGELHVALQYRLIKTNLWENGILLEANTSNYDELKHILINTAQKNPKL